jgi:hypothetical protein
VEGNIVDIADPPKSLSGTKRLCLPKVCRDGVCRDEDRVCFPQRCVCLPVCISMHSDLVSVQMGKWTWQAAQGGRADQCGVSLSLELSPLQAEIQTGLMLRFWELQLLALYYP